MSVIDLKMSQNTNKKGFGKSGHEVLENLDKFKSAFVRIITENESLKDQSSKSKLENDLEIKQLKKELQSFKKLLTKCESHNYILRKKLGNQKKVISTLMKRERRLKKKQMKIKEEINSRCKKREEGLLHGYTQNLLKNDDIHRKQITMLKDELEKYNSCSICFEKFHDSNYCKDRAPVKLRCQHVICTTCAENWLTINACCPHCREPYEKSDIKVINLRP